MAGLDPAIHAFFLGSGSTWMPGSRPDTTRKDEEERPDDGSERRVSDAG
jgi:hypothetical protein